MLTVEVLVILALLVANGIFAMSEIAMVTARRVRLQRRAELGDRRAAAALRLKGDPTDFLSTVQIGITLIGILAGVYSGATFTEQLAAWLGQFPTLAPYREGIALGIVVTVITYLSLIIGELVPKAIALHNPEGIAGLVARPMSGLARLARPVVQLLSASTRVALAALRIRPTHDHPVTEEEIRALIKQATLNGDVAPVEQQIVEKVFRLGDRKASAIMTPRHEIDWIDVHEGVDGIRTHLATASHPRLLLCDGELDKVLGLADTEDLLEDLLAGKALNVRARLRPPLFVPSTVSVFQLLETFRASRVHLALVLDEFGAVEGLVTPSDILEGLVGEMPSEPEAEAGPVVTREDGSWLVEGDARVEDLEGLLGLPPLPEQERGTYQTIAGFAMTRLSRIPRAGDRFAWGGFRFEVVDMDGRRVDKVLVERERASATTDQS